MFCFVLFFFFRLLLFFHMLKVIDEVVSLRKFNWKMTHLQNIQD